MKRLKIKIFIYGMLPFEINLSKIKKWRSVIFDVIDIQCIKCDQRIYTNDSSKPINESDIPQKTMESICQNFEFISHDELVDINLIVAYAELGNRWFLFSLKKYGMDNSIILSLKNVYDELLKSCIPIENIILSALYTYSLVFIKNGALPSPEEEREIMHFDTRGCLFDFTDSISDVKFYTNCPILCSHCINTMLHEDINIKKLNKELKKIRKNTFYRLYENVKENILLYIILTSCFSTFITKITSTATYENAIDILIAFLLGGASIALLLYVLISSKISMRRHYSQNIKSQRTK